MPLLAVLVAILGIAIFAFALAKGYRDRRAQVNVRWDALDAGLIRRTDLAREILDLLLPDMGQDDPYLKELNRILDEEEPRHAPDRRSEYQGRLTIAFRRLAYVVDARQIPGRKALALLNRAREAQENLEPVVEEYNQSVTFLNLYLDTFPGSLLSALFGAPRARFFSGLSEDDKSIREAVK